MTIITNLRVENQVAPIGLDRLNPQFSWRYESFSNGFRQSAYRILAASDPGKLIENQGDLWDSGLQNGSENFGIDYQGQSLTSRLQVFWKVMVWDQLDQPVAWSEIADFQMGLLDRNDWQAAWIGYDKPVGESFDRNARYFVADDFDQGVNKLHLPPVPYLRKAFTVRGAVRKATIHISALGLYELRLDGARIGDRYFTPGWSDYGKRVYYQSYDLSIAEGEHVLGVMLADGWYAGYVGLVSRQVWGDNPRVIAQLEMDFADGSREIIVTDKTWQAAYGEIREADLLHGETVDARIAIQGWDRPACGFSGWEAPDVGEWPPIRLQQSVGPANIVVEKIQPALISQSSDGSLIYDFGKNLTGFVSISGINEPAGTRIEITFAEILNQHGELDHKVYRSARATDAFYAEGSGDEHFEPRFTFRSFRYARIRGLSKQPANEALTGVFVAADLHLMGQFVCSDSVVNQTVDLLKQTLRCGFIEVPMDCCERDERLGWGQDGNHSLRLGSYLFDLQGFIQKWQNDILDSQAEDGAFGPTAPRVEMGDIGQFRGDIMADCGLQSPWILREMYGQTRCARESWPALQRYFAFMQRNSDRNMRNSIAGDWLQILDNGHTDTIHGWGGTARDLIGTAFFAFGAQIMAALARELGQSDEALKYEAQYAACRKAFINTFELRGNRFRDKTQTGYALALTFGLVSDTMRPHLARLLADDVSSHGYGMTGGIPGSAYILDALSEHGFHSTAVKVMTSDEYPGYGYMVRMGATTCWERWDGIHHQAGIHTHNMNAYNHIGLTSAGAWLFRKVAGIDRLAPGFRRILIAPHFAGSIDHVEASYTCNYGAIATRWQKADGLITLDIHIPPGTIAEVRVPACGNFTASADLRQMPSDKDLYVFEVGSGTHTLSFDHNN